MSKLTKLMTNPKGFLMDAVDKRFPQIRTGRLLKAAQEDARDPALLVSFSNWKTWMTDVLPENHVCFLGHSPRVAPAMLNLIPKFKNATVYAWSYKWPEELENICRKNNIELIFTEDGFIRSVGLGTNKSRPMSLVYDKKAMHFDRDKISELDDILNHHSFTESELDAADQVCAAIKTGLTKYISQSQGRSLKTELGIDDNKPVVLVLGQVEDDYSIKHGMEHFMTANDLVAKVALENPDAHILYRPHPESIAVRKKHYSNPQDVAHLCHIVTPEWSLKETFDAADEAHTMTSLTGLEAAVNGLKVHTYGMPFYSGWGFTTDHGLAKTPGKRMRSLSLKEVVAGAYVCYSKYYHPVTGAPINVLEALDMADRLRGHMKRVSQAKETVQRLVEENETNETSA